MRFPDTKREVESLYTGKASVYDFVYQDNGHGAMVKSDKPALVYGNIPCRLSYERKEQVIQGSYGDVNQEIVMYCNPKYDISPGAKVVITQAGSTQEYGCAGLKAMYVSHQEIRLEAFRKRA